MNSLEKTLNSFARLKILVIGEAILDVYLKGDANRLCREGPVPIIDIKERKEAPGGAANTALNTKHLGGQVSFFSIVGDDREGYSLRRFLKREGINVDNLLFSTDSVTLSKNRLIASNQLLARYDFGGFQTFNQDIENQFITGLKTYYPTCDAVVISDYGYGILSPKIKQVINNLQKIYQKILVIDAKYIPTNLSSITAVKPNFDEALRWTNSLSDGNRVEQAKSLAKLILEKTDSKICFLTMDKDGAVILEKGKEVYRTFTSPAENSKAAGAGDTYTSALALSLASGATTQTSAEIASAASQIVVEKEGTSTCKILDLIGFFKLSEKILTEEGLITQLADNYRQRNKKIVFTNGCFDILHSGHIGYLNQAKELGDILIVGVNTDESVKRLKGPQRPINNLSDRMKVLSGLSSVDNVISFSENTPINLIRKIKPDVFVKGGDYTLEELPEAPIVRNYGGKVMTLPYLADHSTTDIISRIKNSRRTQYPQRRKFYG